MGLLPGDAQVPVQTMVQERFVSGLHGIESWLRRGQIRQLVLLVMTQPLTVMQVVSRSGLCLKRSSEAMVDLWTAGCLACLNPEARTGRVYWLTRVGAACQAYIFTRRGVAVPKHFFPDVDWDLYGHVCSSHRRAVLVTLRAPMQPARIKRAALFRNPSLRMSANNCRDTVRFLLGARVVRQVWVKKQRHPLYELTKEGRTMRELLVRATRRPW